MSLRRLATAASTIIVGFMLAVFVPIAQLQTVADQTECCCPDPDKCKCPDHNPDRSTNTTMRACHKQSQDAVTAQLSTFLPPMLELAYAPAKPIAGAPHVIPAPHQSPPPRRPDAPS